MNARREYLEDLLKDCVEAADQADLHEEDRGAVIAALVLSDSLNGLRKALLQLQGASRRGGRDE